MIARPEEKERVLYEFDVFRVDPVRRLLLRAEEPVAITPKALSILLALLEHPGEVVEKAELIERVWPGVFVTEANLTQNIFSLRKCLGERANDNRYIVTVPGQGYSFAGELRRIERSATSEIPIVTAAQEATLAQAPIPTPADPLSVPVSPTPEPFSPLELTAPPVAAVPAPTRTPARHLRRLLIGASVGVVALLVTVTAVHIVQHLGPATPKPQPGPAAGAESVRQAIAVLDFKSLSPSADTRWLQTAFSEMLTTELAAGGKMRVIRGERVAQAVRSLALQDPGSLGAADLQRLHDTLGTDLVVVGSFLPIQGQIRLDLRVVQLPAGETVLSLAERGTRQDLFDLVSRTGEKLRDSLGVAALSPKQVQEAQALRPSNPDSSRLYTEGLTRLRAFDSPGALTSLQQAVKADPGSAVIHSALSRAWSDLGYDASAIDEARKALDLGRSLPREERLAIEGRLYRASKQWSKASEAYRSLWTFFPDDVEYGLQLGESLMLGGRGAEAAATLASLRKLPAPAGEDPRIDVVEARNARRLADVTGALRAAERAVAKGRQSGQSLVVAQALIYQGDALLTQGKPKDAIRLFRESAELARKAGYQWGIGMAAANVGAALQAQGDLDGAEKAYVEALVIAQKIGSAAAIAAQLQLLGALHRDRGELSEARKFLDQSRDWYVKIGERLYEAQVLDAGGAVLISQGDLDGARQHFEREFALSQALGNPVQTAFAVKNLGQVLAVQGELTAARRRYEEAFAAFHKAGEAGSAAEAMAASAGVSAQLGDVRTAWQRSGQAMVAKQQAGDRIGTGRILGLRSLLAYQLGDLAASRALADEQLQIARQTGARSLTALALQNRGRAEYAAGNLAVARSELTEALRVSSALGEELRAMEIRLDLAALALAGNQAGEAAVLARQAAAWYQQRGIPGGESQALSMLAESLLRQGLRGEAQAMAAQARVRLDASEDRELRVTVGVRLGKIEAGTGNAAEALRQLRRAVADAASFGFAAASLEARLALGEVQRGAGDPAAGANLAAVRKEAETRGFKRLALAAEKKT
ncbi:MAG TPA: tetratricopeptide repeat protein [Thermoanaerobaculia bacterium]|jgi:DNA-binding winged helix-turn-helix (wHTH) protein/tetratricopeptide (TPR) repeat protein|nr:tetratricopeptide repeat protein [Thermoanaerobaculia bacterium]